MQQRIPFGRLEGRYVNKSGDMMSGGLIVPSLEVGGTIIVDGMVDGVDVAALKSDVDGFPDDLKDLAQAEIQQLENIGGVTISAGQWGILGGLVGTLSAAELNFCDGVTSALQAQLDAKAADADVLKKNGSVALTADWDIGDGRKIQADEVWARDAAGLKLFEDGGKGIFIENATGYVGIGTIGPTAKLNIESSTAFNTARAPAGQDNILLFNSGATQGQGNYGASIGFTKLNSGTNRVAAITAVQTGSDNDQVGLAFFTQQSSGSSEAIIERLRIDHRGKVGIGTAGPTAFFDINSDILRLRTAKTPASAGASGNAGDICWDSDYVYICVATNTWERVAIATW